MNIYFAASIRGGREQLSEYQQIIEHLKSHGNVLTEHIGDSLLQKEKNLTDHEIYNQDVDWLRESDIIIAEVTTPSLGVGYELGKGKKIEKPILCLYKKNADKSVSAMVSGNPFCRLRHYSTTEEALQLIDSFVIKYLQTKK